MAFESPFEDIEKMRPPEGEALSFTADAAVEAGQVVKLTGDAEVSPSDTDGEETIGVATQSVSAGDTVMVVGNGGRALFTAGDANVSANDPVTSHGATGEEGQVTEADTDGDFIIGYALEAAGSQGDTFRGVVDRGYYESGGE